MRALSGTDGNTGSAASMPPTSKKSLYCYIIMICLKGILKAKMHFYRISD